MKRFVQNIGPAALALEIVGVSLAYIGIFGALVYGAARSAGYFV